LFWLTDVGQLIKFRRVRGAKPLSKILPLPEGKGIQGMGLPHKKEFKNVKSAVEELEEKGRAAKAASRRGALFF